MIVFIERKSNLSVTDKRRPRNYHSFSFNPKNRIFIVIEELLGTKLVAEFVAKTEFLSQLRQIILVTC